MHLILHIGLPKAASTTIQSHLLSGRSEYLGKSKDHSSLVPSEITSRFAKCASHNEFYSFRDNQRNAQLFATYLSALSGNETAAISQIKPCWNFPFDKNHMILSLESLCQWPVSKKASSRWPLGGGPNDNGRRRPIPVAKFLTDHFIPAWKPFGDLTIVLILRNQPDYLASRYAQDSNRRRNANQADFERQVRALLDSGDASIDWGGLVEDLEEAVGRNALTVMLFEEIGTTSFNEQIKEAFRLFDHSVQDVSASLGGKSNARSTSDAVWDLRKSDCQSPSEFLRWIWPGRIRGKTLLAAFSKTVLDPLVEERLSRLMERDRGASIKMTESLRREIVSHCRNSNMRLARKINKPLGSLGY